jgi:hypothetical protein
MNGNFRRGTIKIACRNKAHAQEVAARLNSGDHDGEIRV